MSTRRSLLFLVLLPCLLLGQTSVIHIAPDRTYDVKSYRLDITLDYEERKVSGTVSITLNPLNDGLSEVALDSAELQIHRVEVNGRSADFRSTGEKLLTSLSRPYKSSESITLSISYEGHPRKGLYWVGGNPGDPTRPPQIWSQGEDEDSHYWFPCYDFPNDKATSETIVTVRKPFSVVSNGRLLEVKDGGPTRTFHWKMDTPHSTYLTSVAVGEFEEYKESVGTVSVEYYVPRGTGREATYRAFGRTPEMLRFFSRKFGIPYPYPKYAQVAAVDFLFGGMENISATTQNAGMLREGGDAQDFKTEGTVAHELAHQWWGDLVTAADWSHIWLNEGFATYFEALYKGERLGEDEFRYAMYLGAEEYFDEDARYRRPMVSPKYSKPIDLFDQHTYEKGSLVLGMIHDMLGEELFFKALNHYGAKYAEQNVTTDDFKRSIYESTGKNMERFFDQWVYHAGFPEYDVQWSWVEGVAEITVRQTQRLDDGTSLFDMPIAIDFTLPDKRVVASTARIDKGAQTLRFPVSPKPVMVRFDPGNRVLKKINFRKDKAELLYQAANDPDPIGRIRAIGDLARLGADLEVPKHLAGILRQDVFAGVRVAAATGLGGFLDEIATEALVAAASDKDYRVRAAVAAALGSLRRNQRARQDI